MSWRPRFTIVSGLARGVDAAAHRGALTAGGRTVAVLGADSGEPIPQNTSGSVMRSRSEEPSFRNYRSTLRRIADIFRGAIVSSAGCRLALLSRKRHRQRIVDYGTPRGGTGTQVFAVPGFVRAETSRGTHALIKEGAALIEEGHVIDVICPAARTVHARPTGHASQAGSGRGPGKS